MEPMIEIVPGFGLKWEAMADGEDDVEDRTDCVGAL